jgi:hypothetical protein
MLGQLTRGATSPNAKALNEWSGQDEPTTGTHTRHPQRVIRQREEPDNPLEGGSLRTVARLLADRHTL